MRSGHSDRDKTDNSTQKYRQKNKNKKSYLRSRLSRSLWSGRDPFWMQKNVLRSVINCSERKNRFRDQEKNAQGVHRNECSTSQLQVTSS